MIKVHFITTETYSKELDLEALIRVVGSSDKLDRVDLTQDVYLGIDPYAEDVHGKLEYIATNSLEELRNLRYEYTQDI